MVAMPDLGRCASFGTVAGTVASAAYGGPLLKFTGLALAVGLPCVAVQPMGLFKELSDPRLAVLPLPARTMLPERQWCDYNELKPQYGWRRQMLYKARMWQLVLGAGFNVVCFDLDYVLHANPTPLLQALEQQTCRGGAPSGSKTANCRMRADVVAMYDGPQYKLLNVGSLWIRSTPATRALVDRVFNRTWLSGEQLTLNEELNYNADFAGIGCCHTRCFRQAATKIEEKFRETKAGLAVRKQIEREEDVCEDRTKAMRIVGPPAGTRYKWNKHVCYKCQGENATVGWSSDHYNWITRNKLRFGRCTAIDNVCVVSPSLAGGSNGSANTGDVSHDMHVLHDAHSLRQSWRRCAAKEGSEVGLFGKKANRSKLAARARERERREPADERRDGPAIEATTPRQRSSVRAALLI